MVVSLRWHRAFLRNLISPSFASERNHTGELHVVKIHTYTIHKCGLKFTPLELIWKTSE